VSAKGFRKSYARFLKLDESDLLKRFPAVSPNALSPASPMQADRIELDMGIVSVYENRGSFGRFMKALGKGTLLIFSLLLLLFWLSNGRNQQTPQQTSLKETPIPTTDTPSVASQPLAEGKPEGEPMVGSSPDVPLSDSSSSTVATTTPNGLDMPTSSQTHVVPEALSPKTEATDISSPLPIGVTMPKKITPPADETHPVNRTPPDGETKQKVIPTSLAVEAVHSLPLAGVPAETLVTPPSKGPLTLSLEASEASWVKVLIDNQDTKDVLLQAGDKVKWNAEKMFLLTIGNAGGVRVAFDGRDLGRLGNQKEVIKDRLFTRFAPQEKHKEKKISEEEPF
jgi:cytoskeleton protein RodZ